MAQKKTTVEQYKELLEKLPSVINAELKAQSDALTEIHILAKTDRNAKQIVRDVQSAMLAKFKVEVDHKIISVAQIPLEKGEINKLVRIRFLGLELSFDTVGCAVEVSLECAGKKYAGAESSDSAVANRYRAIALAAADAINDILAKKAFVTLEGVKVTELAGQNVILVALSLKKGGQSKLLVGSCADDESGGVAVVKATLDALNRSIPPLV